MRVLTFTSAADAAYAAATLVADALRGVSRPTLALPTGRTMVPVYAALAELRARGELDLTDASAFNLDELLLPRSHPATFRTYMERHAWERIGLGRERCGIPDSAAQDPAAECARYDAALADIEPLDLALVGVGADGHIAYNLPGPPVAGTHVVELPDLTAEALGVEAALRPLRAITVGFRPLLRARRIVAVATSADKAEAVRHLVDGPIDERWPCSLLLDHPAIDVVAALEAITEPVR